MRTSMRFACPVMSNLITVYTHIRCVKPLTNPTIILFEHFTLSDLSLVRSYLFIAHSLEFFLDFANLFGDFVALLLVGLVLRFKFRGEFLLACILGIHEHIHIECIRSNKL